MGPHEHWHIDVSYINICGTFYFLCSILDGYSRFVIHWEIRDTMKEFEVETVIQRAREQFPGERPRIISDNGPQFVAKDFKEFIRICGMTHVRTSFYYPQSNGKMERWYKTLKTGCIRVTTPLSLEDARRLVAEFVAYYNTVRLHSAIGTDLRSGSDFDRLKGMLRCLFPSASMRPIISLSCSREDDLLKGSAARSCSQRVDETVCFSVLFSRRR